MNETELIKRCKSGESAALKCLYEIYSRQMMAICFRYTGDMMAAEDLLHDGFIKVFMSFHSFNYRGEGSLKAWISKIFVNTALEYLRRNEATRTDFPLEEYREEEVVSEDEYEIPNQVLMNFIAELPEGYRTVFNMYTFEEMSHKEISKLLRINEASSRSQLSRAKNLLVRKIQDYIKANE